MTIASEVWLPATDALPYLGYSRKTLHQHRKSGKVKTRPAQGRQGGGHEVLLEGDALLRYCREHLPAQPTQAVDAAPARIEDEVAALDTMKPYQRQYAMIWKTILMDTAAMTVAQISEYVNGYRAAHPDFAISNGTLYRNRRAYEKLGIRGLCPGWGSNCGESTVRDEWLEHYISVFLREGGPSADACRLETLGFVSRIDPDLDANAFPSTSSFMRKVRSRFPQSYIDFRRKGKRYYQRNYEYYIGRDWSKVKAGEGWVSDHHQLDFMVKDSAGKAVRPWITVWMDLRTNKMLSVYVHAEAPTSDHVMMSFAWAVEKFGLPEFVYLDNGKDYRAIDFSGNYKRHRVWDEPSEEYARSVIGFFEVKVVFAREYNAQAKTIERQFGVTIAFYSKQMRCYTGGNVVQKPETLNADVKSGRMESLDDCVRLTGEYFETVHNRRAANSELLRGMCPDQAWEEHRGTVRMVSKESLKYCYMRSKECRIGREGIVDNTLGIELRYWSDKFYAMRGEPVFIRRDIREYNVAWVFRQSDNAFLCVAQLYTRASGFATTAVEKEELRRQIQRKNADLKLARAATKTAERPDAHEIIANLQAGIAATSTWQPTDTEAPETVVQVTPMDHAAAAARADQNRGKFDPRVLSPVGADQDDQDNEIDIWGISKAS